MSNCHLMKFNLEHGILGPLDVLIEIEKKHENRFGFEKVFSYQFQSFRLKLHEVERFAVLKVLSAAHHNKNNLAVYLKASQ